jgi:adenosyl cobinamide kinase/adenosyl cobinamide phosphate guanylyltransferase
MVTLIIGGARSGKSSYAQALAASWAQPVLVIATAEPLDDEMRSRIEDHRRSRPREWLTVECPRRLPQVSSMRPVGGVVLDCLTLWVSNRLLEASQVSGLADQLARELEEFITDVRLIGADLAMVTNEVGLGLVPDNPLARAFRDVLGTVNQKASALADRVVYMVAGLPLQIKG